MREFLNIDCMDPEKGIPSYPDDFFDLAIVDPPYFTGPEKRVFYGHERSSLGIKRLYKRSKEWKKVDEKYFQELARVARYYIFWGCNYYPDFIFNSGRLVWDKCNDSSDYSDCEIASTNVWDHTRMVRYMWNGMLQGSIEDGTKMQGNKKLNEERIHPTQKPVRLYQLTIDKCKKVLDPGSRILSTHVGSASDLICYDMAGFEYLGFEIDKHHYDNAQKRMKQVLSQSMMKF